MIDRLRRAHDFRRLRQEGTRVRSGALWCMMLLDPSRDTPQVAFAIGRSAGTAVTRNRIRRRLRHILGSTSMAPGLYLFGMSRDSVREPSFEELSLAVQRITARVTAQGGASA